MIEFLVQMPDLELRFQIHFVIVLCPQPVARLSTILAHHNDRRLYRSETGENQIKENKWIWIECARREHNAINDNPDEQHCAETNQKFPTAAELSDVVGESLAKREFP